MIQKINPLLHIETVGDDLLALDPTGAVVVLLTGDEQAVIEIFIAAADNGSTPSDWSDAQLAALNRLRNAGVVVDGGLTESTDLSRRRVLKLSVATVAAAGLTSLVLPAATAAASPVGPIANGGVITDITVEEEPYRVHTFTSSGTFTLNEPRDIEYLIIGGGGGGGALIGGGGGAGQFTEGTATALATGDYPVTVGDGGAGGTRPPATDGGVGGSSEALGLTAVGGGGGGNNANKGVSGASGGGGGASSGTASGGAATAGFAGGNGSLTTQQGAQAVAGGGGGAGGVGAHANASTQSGGNGGAGNSSSIRGTATSYAGGGGGSLNSDTSSLSAGTPGTGSAGGGNGGGKGAGNARGGDATANSGSGGGGGANTFAAQIEGKVGGDGGSGVVILRYRINPVIP